ncbi:hypothetical protein E2C01_056880 [Portunus trituberculatus]|uniref:Uncharacterized protein n=1 Tax=Portunus trituberculatus TaxID=210409 RepID=A0A5B7GRJ3_PORTR|nr:hypothetical protein [Portunus trituberculatus]
MKRSDVVNLHLLCGGPHAPLLATPPNTHPHTQAAGDASLSAPTPPVHSHSRLALNSTFPRPSVPPAGQNEL